MKNRKILKFSILGLLPISLLVGGTFSDKKQSHEVDAYSRSSLPTTIDLNASTESEIRDYYSSLNSKGAAQKQGTNLLKNLKTILSNGQKYFSYDKGKDDIWKAYEIVDRDWDLSPASAITNGSYNATTKIISNYTYKASTGTDSKNPYVHALYVDRTMDNPMRAWGNHTQDYGGINQEHIWPKSHGFDTASDGGARGDLMHLWAADGYSNNMHNNWAYGFVDPNKIEKSSVDKISYATHNYLGTSLTLGTGTVFEPQDSDKGDVARALFYMAARYNNYAGAASGIDSDDPFLVLDDYTVKEAGTSTATTPMKYGVLSDLLEWNKLDPVDEFEIRRNNILFKNYTNNRNPFIDFPQWADMIWGDYGDSDVVNPSTDIINGGVQEQSSTLVSIAVTSKPSKLTYFLGESFSPAGMVVTATYQDNSTQVVKNFNYTSTTFTTAGHQDVQISYGGLVATVEVNVINKVDFDPGTYTFTITADQFNGSSYVGNNTEKTVTVDGTNKEVYWYSYNAMKMGGIQLRKTGGYICNTIPLGSIKSVAITSTQGSFKIYYGSTFKPESNELPGGRYFCIYNDNNTLGKITSIVVTFEITNDPLMTSIELSGNYKTNYKINDQFDGSNLVVKAVYEDNSKAIVTENITVTPPAMDTVGKDNVTVTYRNANNETFTAVYEIELRDFVTKIELSGNYKKTFKYNEAFTKTGLVVTAVTEEGDTIDVSNTATLSTPNMKKLGEQTITVTYVDSLDGTFTATYKIQINNYATKIEAKGDYQTEFVEGEEFNYDGLELLITNADNSTTTVTSGFTVETPKEFKLGENTITVKYQSLTTTYKITVVEAEDPVSAIIEIMEMLGCSGSLATTSLLVSASSVLGIILLKKKKDN